MSTSIFLAQLMGPLMLLMGAFAVLNPERIRRIGREFLESEALLLLSGILTLPVGLAIVLNHNVWSADWRVLITVIGWIAVFAGITRITLPSLIQKVGETMLGSSYITGIPGGVMALIGAFLSWHGYIV